MGASEWGPLLWRWIHCISITYDFVTDNHKDIILFLLNNLHTLIPCDSCQREFIEYIHMVPINVVQKNSNELFKWTYELHNHINKKLFKNSFEYINAYDKYSTFYINNSNSNYIEIAIIKTIFDLFIHLINYNLDSSVILQYFIYSISPYLTDLDVFKQINSLIIDNYKNKQILLQCKTLLSYNIDGYEYSSIIKDNSYKLFNESIEYIYIDEILEKKEIDPINDKIKEKNVVETEELSIYSWNKIIALDMDTTIPYDINLFYHKRIILSILSEDSVLQLLEFLKLFQDTSYFINLNVYFIEELNESTILTNTIKMVDDIYHLIYRMKFIDFTKNTVDKPYIEKETTIFYSNFDIIIDSWILTQTELLDLLDLYIQNKYALRIHYFAYNSKKYTNNDVYLHALTIL